MLFFAWTRLLPQAVPRAFFGNIVFKEDKSMSGTTLFLKLMLAFAVVFGCSGAKLNKLAAPPA